MHIYNGCHDLPIWNFHMIYTTNDFRYMVVGWDGYENIKVPKGANEQWDKIKNEWIKLIDNNVIAYYNQLLLECIYLETRYEVVGKLLATILDYNMKADVLDKFKESLANWEYYWNDKNAKFVEVKRLYKQLKASKNKIKIKIDELKRLKEENDFEGEGTTLEKQAIIIESVSGVKIDIKKDSVTKWVEACKLTEKINEQRRKANGK